MPKSISPRYRSQDTPCRPQGEKARHGGCVLLVGYGYSPLNTCGNQFVGAWRIPGRSEQIISGLHVERSQDRRHDARSPDLFWWDSSLGFPVGKRAASSAKRGKTLSLESD